MEALLKTYFHIFMSNSLKLAAMLLIHCLLIGCLMTFLGFFFRAATSLFRKNQDTTIKPLWISSSNLQNYLLSQSREVQYQFWTFSRSSSLGIISEISVDIRSIQILRGYAGHLQRWDASSAMRSATLLLASMRR